MAIVLEGEMGEAWPGHPGLTPEQEAGIQEFMAEGVRAAARLQVDMEGLERFIAFHARQDIGGPDAVAAFARVKAALAPFLPS